MFVVTMVWVDKLLSGPESGIYVESVVLLSGILCN